MKAIMVMFDSLNRRMLSPYGCDWVQTPNFQRLAKRCATFDNACVGSMPCMPARRELHTGRYNFLHRSWGPLEPFDDSMPRILNEHGVYTHLVSDHYHYWEEGGANYHTKYRTWEIARGQEGDPCKGVVKEPVHPPMVGRNGTMERQDWINRTYMRNIKDQPQPKTFAMGMEFIRTNAAQDNWFLQIETFDPHEPYFTSAKYKKLYPHNYKGRHFDWPPYRPVQETPEEIQHCRYESAALHSMCDDYLGRVLDLMGELHLWQDTLLIVNTDHGFLLGEHDCWAKCWMPFYDEVVHMPLFIWDPRSRVENARRAALVQTIDLPATLLDYFGAPLPADMQGLPLKDAVAIDAPVRAAGLFGIHGGHVNVTDGRYVYMRAPATHENTPLFNYTLMPAHMRTAFGPRELGDIQLQEPFAFTKGCRTIKTAAGFWRTGDDRLFTTMLFDLQRDPQQMHPITDPAVEQRMLAHLEQLMQDNDAPVEQYQRLGLRHG